MTPHQFFRSKFISEILAENRSELNSSIVENFVSDKMEEMFNELCGYVEKGVGSESDIIIERAVTHFGKNPQVLQAIEEMAELTKALLKNVNRGKDNLDDIADEMADVWIMMLQLEKIYFPNNSGPGILGPIIAKKLIRVDERMNQVQ
jgi:hypothetical protein